MLPLILMEKKCHPYSNKEKNAPLTLNGKNAPWPNKGKKMLPSLLMKKKNARLTLKDKKKAPSREQILLTHISLASHKRDIGKKCRPRSGAAERGLWSGSTLFALSSDIPT